MEKKFKKAQKQRTQYYKYLVWFDDFTAVSINDVAVTDSTDRALVKGHNVLRQGTRLVREDVFTLKNTTE